MSRLLPCSDTVRENPFSVCSTDYHSSTNQPSCTNITQCNAYNTTGKCLHCSSDCFDSSLAWLPTILIAASKWQSNRTH